jgi:hypothetical protein
MIKFPDLPHYRAEWRPLQFEAIPGSGERFTFAIMARGEDGLVDIRDALKPDALRAMFGNQGEVLQGLMIRSILGIKKHLDNKGDWLQPPLMLSNLFLGPIRPTQADDLDQVFDQAIRLSACLGHSSIGAGHETAVDVHAEIKEWAARVKSYAMTIDERVKPYFNMKIRLNDQKSTKSMIGFLTQHYAASFGVLHARSERISSDITSIKRRLWDLNQLRFSGLMYVPQELEIIVGHPSFDLIQNSPRMVSTLKGKLHTLHDEAANASIGVKEATSPMEAADYLVRKVANG